MAPYLLQAILLAGSIGRALGQSPAQVGQRITAIEFDCAAPIDREGLRQIMPFRVGDELRAGDLETARRRLELTQIFTDVRVETQAGPGGVAIVAHLVRQVILDAIHFDGNETLGNRELLRAARVQEGMVLTEKVREYALSRLRERYAAEGFDAARITANVSPIQPGEVALTFTIEEGRPLRIGAIEIPGVLPLPLDEVRKVLPLEVGDRYTKAKRRQAQAALIRLFRKHQYYEVDVEIRWQEQEGILRFTIEPGPPFAIQFVGNRELSDKRLLKLMDLDTRPIVTDGTWRELARRARRTYQEDGYHFARVKVSITPGPPKHVRFDITEGESFRIAEVTFFGNHAISASRLLGQMATRPPSWIPWRRGIFLQDVFDDDLKRLWFFYRQEGFQEAQIVDARTRFDRDQRKVNVSVFIEEGRRTIVRNVVRVGTEVIADHLPKFGTAAGKPLNPEQVQADRQALLGAFAQAGYTHAQVATEVQTSPAGPVEAATVQFTATAGEQQHIGVIIVQNDLETYWRVILRELPFASGAPLNPDALLRGQSEIYQLGLFRSVTVRPLEPPENATTRDVGVSVAERPPVTLQWGTGYNTRDGIRGFLQVDHNNVQGLARRISLRGELSIDPGNPSQAEYIASLGFREPRLGMTQWSFGSNLLGQRSTRSVDQFSLERLAFIPVVGRTLLPNLRAGLEFQAEQNLVFDVKPDVLAFNPRDAGRLRTISLSPLVVYDSRDDALAPRRGIFATTRLKFAPQQLGSQVPFVKLTGQHSQYIPIGHIGRDPVTFLYAARAGWARAYQGGDQVPIRERFFLGGRTTVRGFSENSIGPKGSLGDPLGGDMVLNLNAELDFPIVFGVGGAVFVDGGGVYLQDRAISLHDFRRSTGLGLRYLTPVGPISLDYGFKLDRRAGESIGEIHFSIGTIF